MPAASAVAIESATAKSAQPGRYANQASMLANAFRLTTMRARTMPAEIDLAA
jgi:hypothetical protein